MMIIIKVGVFLENNVLPHSKPTKQRHQGSLWGIEIAYKELHFLLPFSAHPATVTVPLNHHSSIYGAQNIYFYKKQSKSKQPTLPTISTVLNEEEIHYQDWAHPVTF